MDARDTKASNAPVPKKGRHGSGPLATRVAHGPLFERNSNTQLRAARKRCTARRRIAKRWWA